MEIGREIQVGFLPLQIPKVHGWNIKVYFQAAREVAGDFYDIFELGPGKIGLLLGDVTDKGVGAALYMALYRSLLRATILADTLTTDPQAPDCEAPEDCLLRTVSLVNRYICTSHDSALYATLFIGILDVESGRICYINAGHDPPFRMKGRAIEETIAATGPMIGALEEAEYKVETFVLEPGDTLVTYSDGIPDALDEAGERFSGERLRSLLQENSSSPNETFNAVLSALEQHIAAGDQFDDVTLMMISRD
jgi:sigma-B regulation protein RsbU (phosphoserine phosphatase)